MEIIKKVYERTFSHKVSTKAYMKACEFVARHIISANSKVEVKNVTWAIERVETIEKDSLPTFRLTIYCKINDNETIKSRCEACKEFHKSFYINENFNCDRCNQVSYRKFIDQRLMIVESEIRKKIEHELDRF